MSKILLFIVCFVSCATQAQQVDSLKLMEDLKELSSDTYQGRQTGTYGGRLAQFFLVNRFREIGLEAYTEDYKMGFKVLTEKIDKALPDSVVSNYKYIRGANIVGYIKGESAETIVITAHFDHLGVENKMIYNGADDNASGTSALLAIATYFKTHPPVHSLIFVAFDAEEMFMQGSVAFMRRSPVPTGNMILNINMDMIGTSTFNELSIGGTFYSPQFKPVLKKLINTSSTGLRIGFGYDIPQSPNNRVGRSDHAAFFVANIPFLYFGVPEHANYHQPTDDYDHITNAFYYRTVNFILKAAVEIDSHFPLPNKHD